MWAVVPLSLSFALVLVDGVALFEFESVVKDREHAAVYHSLQKHVVVMLCQYCFCLE
jgi:hypothetical protein